MVARYLGVVEAVGSSPVTQTILVEQKRCPPLKARRYGTAIGNKKKQPIESNDPSAVMAGGLLLCEPSMGTIRENQ